jgi:HD-GYP domain-containing protein (c-di-GMP phosphodiesterase class II)
MYVAALDRPWLETPFLFQGFRIRDEKVLDELRAHCEHVYVDPALCDAAVSLEGLAVVSATAVRTAPTCRDNDMRRLVDAGELELKRELVEARKAHANAEHAVSDFFARVGAGRRIDLKSVQDALDPMIDSLYRNDDAISWLARMKRKSDYIYDHSLSSSVWAMLLGKHLGFNAESIQVLGTGAMFMDVGKDTHPDGTARQAGAAR